MIELLAADAGGSGAPWWIGFAVPIGVITGALIAGLFAIRTTRKLPYEKLEKLIGIHNSWPEDLHGKETVGLAIEFTLGEVRWVDKLARIPKIRFPDPDLDARVVEQERVIDLMVEADRVEASVDRLIPTTLGLSTIPMSTLVIQSVYSNIFTIVFLVVSMIVAAIFALMTLEALRYRRILLSQLPPGLRAIYAPFTGTSRRPRSGIVRFLKRR